MRMKQVGVVCYICGREFGTRSIGIHEPQCIKKWDNQNNKLPKSKRQPRPVKPVEFDEPLSNNPQARSEQIEKMNMASNAAATENLAPCKNCSRTFLPERIEAHEKVCCSMKMTPAQRLQSNSGYYGQRVVVVDGEQVDAIAIKKEKTFSTNTLTKTKTEKQYSTNTLTATARKDSTNKLQDKVERQINQNITGGALKTLPCQFCGKAISHNSMNVHVKKCRSRSEPTPQTSGMSECSFCSKRYPHNVIAVHIRNCSSAPKKLLPAKGPSEKVSPKRQVSKPRLNTYTPPKTPPHRVDPLPNNVSVPYARYSPRPSSSDRLSASLDISLDSQEVDIDLVLGVDPGLVINCMICGLIVLKSKLNTHYHNYCQKTNMSRSITIPPSTKLPKPPAVPQPTLVSCDICNRSFKSDVIEVHEIRCAIKNQDELSRSVISPEVSPERNLNQAPNPSKTNGLSSPTHVIGKVVTGRFVPCINCGKQFTVRSLVIHQKQCMK